MTKFRTVKAMVFPVIMYRCESWTIKKAECWRIDAFKLWSWRRLLRLVPWKARRANQSILKEINPGCSLEGLMLKLKLQDWGHLMGIADSLEKILMLGKTEGRRRGWWHHLIQWTWTCETLGDGEGWESLVCCSPWDWEELDMTWRMNNNNYGRRATLVVQRWRLCLPIQEAWC